MKELSIEEKAKAYDKVLEKAKALYGSAEPMSGCSVILETIFPELKENEDEKIRKEIIAFIKKRNRSGCDYDYDKWLAWLEKQGKEFPASEKRDFGYFSDPVDKVEPKFKVGEWITNGQHCHFETDVQSVDKQYHLWTIQDAKDGDVLWHSDSASNGIFIFKEIRYDGKVLCYCDYDSEDHFCTGEHHTCCWSNAKYIKPATKTQRNLLFAKMREAGYEWNADKKELKLLINNGGDFDSENCEQKPAWSEEDEKMLNSIIEEVYPYGECSDYPDEEEREYYHTHQKMVDWLKSLKQRIGWKPSIAQLNALSIVSKGNAPDDIEAIVSLYNDLKKL